MFGGNPGMDWHPIQGVVEILLVASCYRNWNAVSAGLMDCLAHTQTLLPHLSRRLLLLQNECLCKTFHMKLIRFSREWIYRWHYIFIPIVLHKDSFFQRGKSKFGVGHGLFIHDLAQKASDLPQDFRFCSPVRDFFFYVFKFWLDGMQICFPLLYQDQFASQKSQPTQFFLMLFSVFTISFSVHGLICD